MQHSGCTGKKGPPICTQPSRLQLAHGDTGRAGGPGTTTHPTHNLSKATNPPRSPSLTAYRPLHINLQERKEKQTKNEAGRARQLVGWFVVHCRTPVGLLSVLYWKWPFRMPVGHFDVGRIFVHCQDWLGTGTGHFGRRPDFRSLSVTVLGMEFAFRASVGFLLLIVSAGCGLESGRRSGYRSFCQYWPRPGRAIVGCSLLAAWLRTGIGHSGHQPKGPGICDVDLYLYIYRSAQRRTPFVPQEGHRSFASVCSWSRVPLFGALANCCGHLWTLKL